jgi:aryl-alcohol dehydrogenase-like predicted oxidoreductase
MDQNALGTTGLTVSAMGFGCGAVGGLMVRGEPSDQERAVARAIELGITYFDTAPSYGDGASETNFGRVLRTLRPEEIVIGTKFHVKPGDPAAIEAEIAASLEDSLRRLGREQVDLLQLHSRIGGPGADALAPKTVIEHVIPALLRLRQQGKIRFAGITAIGATDALHEVIGTPGLSTAQVPYNLLTPTAGRAVPAGYPAHDFGNLLEKMHTTGTGTGTGAIAIRVLAAGALSASDARHPIAARNVAPIGSGPDYATDVRRAKSFEALLDEAGAQDVVELAIRYVISHPAISTAMVGLATLGELETAAGAASKGKLPAAVLHRIAAIQDGFSR